ncbi:hypothetical protein B5F53_02775 [Blautia sp. An249]|nr:hypothetical protein B5F53_02775 [Blautia sp. An249]
MPMRSQELTTLRREIEKKREILDQKIKSREDLTKNLRLSEELDELIGRYYTLQEEQKK